MLNEQKERKEKKGGTKNVTNTPKRERQKTVERC